MADSEIATQIELLDIRGFQKDLPEAAQARILKEWLEDLAEFPAWAVRLACRKWRRSNVGKPPYASGQLMSLVESEMREFRVTISRAREALSIKMETA